MVKPVITRTADPPPACDAEVFAVRKATMKDLPEILRLINGYAAQGIMLPRTEFEMAENLRDFSVIECGGEIAGCGALHFYTPAAGEVRSLAVGPQRQRRGAGKSLVEALEAEGEALGLQAVFAFTYVPDFFRKLGYEEIERSELPLKAWKDCLRCPKFQCCDEYAVIKRLDSGETRVFHTPIRGADTAAHDPANPATILPVLGKSR